MKHTIIALAIAGLFACAGSTAQEAMDDESDFFETAASACMFEIEAGKLAQAMGTSPAVKDFGEKVVTDHEKATAALRKLAGKKGIALPSAMLERHQVMLDDLKDEQGTAFDNEYRLKMIASHKEAISLFDQAAKQSADADVKAFAARTLPTLQYRGGMAKDLPKS